MAKNGTLGSGQPFLVVLCGVQKAPAFSQETDGVTKGPLESPPTHCDPMWSGEGCSAVVPLGPCVLRSPLRGVG